MWGGEQEGVRGAVVQAVLRAAFLSPTGRPTLPAVFATHLAVAGLNDNGVEEALAADGGDGAEDRLQASDRRGTGV